MFPLIKKNIFFIISLQIFFSFIIIISPNQIIFPFKTEPINIDSSKYIEAITNNKIYITTEIGEPPQKINLLLTMDSSSLLIANSSIDSSYYNNIKSNTYLNTEKLDNIYFELYTKGYYANDNFIFQISYDNSNKKKFNNIQFIHVIEFSDQKYLYSGYFGLQLPKENKKMHIIENLKQENAISSYIFNLNYTSDNEGYLSIGEYPPELKDEKKIEELKRTKALPCENNDAINRNDLCWNLKFNDDDLISTYFNRPTLVGLANIGTPYYMNAILQCFCQIEEFASYFKFNRYVNYISNNYEKLGKNCLSKSFKILIDNIWPITLHNKINSSNNIIYSPVEFKEKIFKMSNLKNKTSVNDIKDFINLILLHEELNKKTLNNNINNNIIQNTTNFYEAFQCFYSDFQNNYCSKISELFYGIQMTETTCLNCNSSQYNFQTYFSLIFSLKKVQKYALNKYQFQKQFLLN